MAIIKRKRYLIKHAFQLKYVAMVIFFIFVTSLISCAAVYFAIFPYLSEKLANVYPQGRLATILRGANVKMIIVTLFILPIATWFSIVLSHRIAGPWHRLEMILKEMAEGSLMSKVKLRKGDELQSLGTALNEVILNLRTMSQENVGYIGSIDETLNSFENELNKEPIDLMKVKLLVSKMQEMSDNLKSSLKRHKLR